MNKILFWHQEGEQKFIKIDRRLIVALLVVILLVVTGLFGNKYLFSSNGNGQNIFSTIANPLNTLKAVLTPKFGNSTNEIVQPIKIIDEQSQVIDVVKKNSPAVVSIVASAEVPKMEQCYTQNPAFQNIPGFENFNFQIPSVCQNGTEKKQVGAGTGFIVSPDGYIVTNKHVVEDEKADYTVILNDEKNKGQKFKATVMARDPNNDIAILRIDKSSLPSISFGDSDKLQVGQTAIAIGYSLGQFDNTVSKGVVSGLARSIVANGLKSGPEQLRGLIQTDAAINPGNSGGPLLDLNGNAIGINVAMADAQNIGFALPINSVRLDYEQVKKSGTIKASDIPYLGVRFTAITEEMKQNNNLPYDYGMLVVRGDKATDLAVVPGSPADRAGLVENDIILEADGQQLNESYTLGDAVLKHKPGDNMTLKVYDKGNIKTVIITVGKK